MPLKTSILLIIVNYNQETEVSNFLSAVGDHWPTQHTVLVDDGSTDRSLVIAQSHGLKTISHDRNFGVGAAIRTGILHAHKNGYDAVLIMSSNGKMLPSEIERVTKPLVTGQADYVTGSRFLEGGNSPGLTVFRKLSIPIFSIISTILLAKKFSDITCGFRCYKISWLFEGKCDIEQPWLSRYELEYYIHFWACHLGLKIQEVPVTIRYTHLESDRKSKIRPLIDWWSMIKPLFYLRLGIKK